ncbi:MAG: hypothetical protein PHH59_16660 [Methylovulum sp.]|uniref:hypothetical protein n=1 Tax=Methylovulum sp. TaxID=1916980 RepID=UPI002626D8C9|nr:hypothetical protein [Methylovulum sp.]MDD2725633.1 hypothetical protein [Methylovulum sp.]
MPVLQGVQSSQYFIDKSIIIPIAGLPERFDHRVLQDVHDIIAATYRYRFDDGLQGDLFESDDDLRKRYLVGWAQWFFADLETLVNYPDFVR